MQVSTIHKAQSAFPLFSLLFFIAAVSAAIFEVSLLLITPFVLIGIFFLLQKVEYCFYLLLFVIPWSIEFHFNERLGTDFPDEALMILTSVAVLTGLLQLERDYLKRLLSHPVVLILLLQIVWIVLTIFFSSNPVISIKFFLAKMWYLLAFVGAPLILFQQKKQVRNSSRLLLISMLILVVTVLLRHLFWGFTFNGINPSLQPFFRNHVNYSSLLVCMVPLLIAAVRLSIKKYKKLLVCLLLVVVFALITSYARGAWLALLVGLCGYPLIRKQRLVAAFILVIAISLGAVFWLQKDDNYLKFAPDFRTTVFHADFREHLIATYQMKDVSNAERFYRWIAGARMVPDSWLTGFGPNTFYDNYKSYALPLFKTWVSNNEDHSTVHNYFLLSLIEQGVMGLFLFLSLIGYLLYTAQKVYHRTTDLFWKTTAVTAAAILLMILTVNFLSDLIETDKVGSMFYLCVATSVVADMKTRIAIAE